MLIKNYKKKLIRAGAALAVAGLVITLIGFGMSSFRLDSFETNGKKKWYRTIDYNRDFIRINVGI